AVIHRWRGTEGATVLAMKGAPESVVPLCGLAESERAAASAAQSDAASRGLRLLAVAHARDAGDGEDLAAIRWELLGFVALADPVRATVPAAVALFRRAGIRVVMITGDHPETARAIATQAGIDASTVITGAELAAMDPATPHARLAHTQVFARVRPEDKLRLVRALRQAGEIVAMTGDGVNDAPALKAAHIGVAMGTRGSDVARESASLVLLEDDFSALVGTVRLGRRIYDNIRNAMRFLVAVHVPLAGMAFFPLAVGWPLFLFPVHVVFLEFVIDPACSLVFEAERSDAGIMERAPRPVGERIFSRESVALALLLGLGVLAAVAAVLGVALAAGRGDETARTMAFVTLVCGDIALIFANRRQDLTLLEMVLTRNWPLAWIVAGTAAALALAIYFPAATRIFRFAPLSMADFAMSAAIGFGSVLWYDAYKIARRRHAIGRGARASDP
ncbi:MAG TPA: cation-translocating P-type ATPase, partial [Usitatibacter sp.]|nr:cation-translocating P-type ATPase [Usitatibacter sp.]